MNDDNSTRAVIHLRRAPSPTHPARPSASVVIAGRNGILTSAAFTADPDTPAAAMTVGTEAFLWLRSQVAGAIDAGDPVSVYIPDRALREFVFDNAHASHGLRQVRTPCGSFRELTLRASMQLPHEPSALYEDHSGTAADTTDVAEPRSRLVVATDASRRLGRGGAGIAYVTADGDYRSLYRRVASVCEAELMAIELAVLTYASSTRPLLVLSDSQNALECLTRPQPWREHDQRIERVTRQVLEAASGKRVRFRWVRGHSGHPLNEVADRLAVAARRHHDAGIPLTTRRRITEQIVGSLTSDPAAHPNRGVGA